MVISTDFSLVTSHDLFHHPIESQSFKTAWLKTTPGIKIIISLPGPAVFLIPTQPFNHQEFQVPKMVNLIRLFWGWISPLHKPYMQLT